MNNPHWLLSRRVLLSLVVVLCASSPIYGGPITITDNFNDNSLNTSLWTPLIQGSGSVSETNHRLELSTLGSSGTDTIAGVSFLGTFAGDFDIQISYTLLSPFPSINSGPVAGMALTQFADLVFVLRGADTNGPYYSADVGVGQPETPTSDSSGRLQLTRTGSNWAASYWSGSAWQVIASDNTRGTGPISSLVLVTVISGPGSTSVALDDFYLQAGQVTGVVPEPASLLLLGTGLVGLGRAWRKRRP